MTFKKAYLSIVLLVTFTTIASAQTVSKFHLQQINNTNQPWARWWWMGSAVDKPNLKKSLIDFHKAGIGGVEITPIYGVKGEENNFIDFLSPKWLEMLDYTIHVSDSLHMEVDMVLGTGWPYGGLQVTVPNAATKLIINKFEVKKGKKIDQNITPPKAEKIPAQLLYVIASGEDGSYIDLTDKIQKGEISWKQSQSDNQSQKPEIAENHLIWKASKTNYTIYAVFSGKTGQEVKRSAPGGKGYTVDHYSKKAFDEYVVPFDAAFKGREGKIRAIFNDSFEVYGADFTPNLFDEFQKRRGYDLRKHLSELTSTEDTEKGNRIKSDYRETISDLLLNEFDKSWTTWANSKKFITKLQAHGSPGNLIDIYAAADIPECETFGSMPYAIPGFRREKEDIREGDADPVMLKFSSSAGHIAGKPLISSETFTWLRDHFKTALSQCKPEVEDLFLNGINHTFLHGSTYSPTRATWPGWKFYASVNFNSNNTIWEDAPSLFSYIANCQSLLQQGKPDNEVLLYWPVYDQWNKFAKGEMFMQFKIHSLSEWLYGTSFYETTKILMSKGYSVDFVSDAFIKEVIVKDGKIVLPGGTFQTLIIPVCKTMPLETLKKLIELKKKGAKIIFEGLPQSVPGFNEFEKQNAELQNLLTENKSVVEPSSNLINSLTKENILLETLVNTGLKFIRRSLDNEKLFYVVNHTNKTINEMVPLQVADKEVVIFDPLTKEYGNAIVQKSGNQTFVKLHIEPGQSLMLITEETASQQKWNYWETASTAVPLNGKWQLNFDKGGPELPQPAILTALESWTKLSPQAEAFSGSATYTLQFDSPKITADNWSLDLGDVRESAKVWLNGTYLGTAWSVPYKLNIGKLKPGKNELKIQVTNLGANRVRDMEIKGREWKIFYEINMVDKDYKKFDATKWTPTPSGLLGPISITPLKNEIKN